ncbi:hypothetical protein D3C81_2125140 [compost metagenome]
MLLASRPLLSKVSRVLSTENSWPAGVARAVLTSQALTPVLMKYRVSVCGAPWESNTVAPLA